MTSPFRFRPQEPEADVDHDGEKPDWQDNALSNFLAWGSTTFTPTWCQSPEDWASRFSNYLWTSCPCCMLFRGLALGFFISGVLWLLIVLAVVSSR